MTSRTFVPWVEPVAQALADGRAQVLEFARSAPPDFWDKPSTVEGWRNKDLLAHNGRGNDQIMQKVLRAVTAGKKVDRAELPTDVDAANARGVGEQRDRSVAELIAAIEEEGAEIQDLLSKLSAEDEGVRQDDPPFVLEGFLRFVAREGHDLEHLAQLQAGLEVSA
jgi:hypothetical protein